MEVLCPTHNTKIENFGRCEECVKESIKAFNEHFKGQSVTIGGFPATKTKKVLIDGELVSIVHEYGYLECDCPEELIEELNEYVTKRILEFQNNCRCWTCRICNEQVTIKVDHVL